MRDIDNRAFGAWARMNKLFEEADTLEKLKRLYMEGGMSEADALAKAIAQHAEATKLR